MKNNEYFPRFIAKWIKHPQGIQVYALKESITLEEMNVQAISSIEKICSGKNNLDEVIRKLSLKWDKDDIVTLIYLFIEKQIIVNNKEVNPLVKGCKLKKIETLLPNQETVDILNLPYQVIYGRAGSDIWSSGKDIDINIATNKMISEIAEWNAWNFPKKECTLFGSFESLASKNILVPPSDIINYADFQYSDILFPYKIFNPLSNYNWICAKNFINNEKVFIFSEHILFTQNPIYVANTSSGCSAHVNKNKAIHHAVHELIERDAFMIYWLNKLDRPRINLNSLPESIIFRVKNIQNLGYRLTINDTSMGIAPVIMVALQDIDGCYVTSGLASLYDFEAMFSSALSEVEVSLLHILNSKKIVQKKLKPETVKSLVQHEELHQQIMYQKDTSFIFESSKEISFKNFMITYKDEKDIIKTILDKGFDLYVVDATDWEIDVLLPEHRHIVRAIIPGLVPLSFGYHKEPLGMSRIYEVPVQLGFRSNTISYQELNRFPHPFN